MARIIRLLRRALLLFAGLAVLGVLALGVLYWLISPRLPDVQELRNVQLQVPLSIYTRDGKLLALIGETRRFPVEIENVPQHVKDAFIAIEDARFYEHPGVDWRGISRAVWLLATTDDERVPGGSTITQQVAKQFFLSSEYSYTRKITEIFLALKMERELSKDEIFELYLNKSFFGNRAYGIAAAADFYYGKTMDQLTLGEAATLASIPKFPSSGNPIINPDRALIRRNYVLQRMREEGLITPAEEVAAQAEAVNASPHEPRIEAEAPYVAEMVRVEMEHRYGAEATTSGLRVYTTIDSTHQAAAALAVQTGLLEYDRRHGWRGPEAHLELADDEDDAALRKRLKAYPVLGGLPAGIVSGFEDGKARLVVGGDEPRLLDAKATQWTGKSPQQLLTRGDVVRIAIAPPPPPKPGAAAAAAAAAAAGEPLPKVEAGPVQYLVAQIPAAQSTLVSMQPEDGAIRALVGGFSFGLNKFNRATQAQRQPGSSFKPFIYAAAFERGFTPASIVLDAPVVFRDRAGNVWRPQNDAGNFAGPMRLREALVQSRNLVSVRLLDAIGVDFASRYITQFGFSKESLPPNLSMSLGTASLTPLSMARGYTVFANGGFLIEPYFVDRVLDRDGVELSKTNPARACRACPGRLVGEQRAATVVDGFDFGPAGGNRPAPAADPAAAPAADAVVGDEPAPAPAPPAPTYDGPLNLAPRAIDERTAFLVSSLMRDVVKRGTATAARVLEREDLGGKTGSTNEHRDAWFSGFGGDLVTTVWVGKDDFKTLGYREYGGRAALPIWINYMREALAGVPVNEAVPPAGVITATIAPGTGRLLPEGTPGGLTEYFKSEDYDRVTTSGFELDPALSDEEAFDIF